MNALHKVLVVDDDPVVGKSFNRVLSDKGYLVITAQNAQEALTKMRDAKYDVVFTDIKMPGMDGIELAETVKATHPWTPVVIVTGYGTTANEERAKAAGVSAFLRKPLSPEVIEGSAANALREAPMAAAARPEAVPEAAPVEITLPAAAAQESTLKRVALFLAAPFISLAYVMLFPFVGLGMLVLMAVKAGAKHAALRSAMKFLNHAAMLIAAPFIGLLYIIVLPFAGATMLIWVGVKALRTKPPVE